MNKHWLYSIITLLLIVLFGATLKRCEAAEVVLTVDTVEPVDTIYRTTGSYSEPCYKKNPETGQLEPTECNMTYTDLRGFPVAFKGSIQLFWTSDSTWYWIDSNTVYVPYWWDRWPLSGRVGQDSITIQLENLTVTTIKRPGAVVRKRKQKIHRNIPYLLNGRKVMDNRISRLRRFNMILIKN